MRLIVFVCVSLCVCVRACAGVCMRVYVRLYVGACVRLPACFALKLPTALPPSMSSLDCNSLSYPKTFPFQELGIKFKIEAARNPESERLLLTAAVASIQSTINAAYQIPLIVK